MQHHRPGTSRGLVPRDVPGWAQAAAAGQLPRVPEAPPRPVAPTAHAVFVRLIIGSVLGALVVTAVAEALEGRGLGATRTSLLVLAVLAVAVLAFSRATGALAAVVYRELEQGYTTLVLTFGGFAPSSRPGWWSPYQGRIGWDYRGVWVLRSDGTVVTAPDRSVDPPGFYPSPHRPGQRELWTGSEWAGQFRG